VVRVRLSEIRQPGKEKAKTFGIPNAAALLATREEMTAMYCGSTQQYQA